ncbi:MAG TPA: PAS domain-containing protein [Verrucomicrobiae bacterium]|nr:PAS domain-containing protein [Verrucomicrobiae bacterium]
MHTTPKPGNTELLKKNEALTATVDGLREEVAKREQAERALSQERLILHTLIDNLPDGIYAKDINGRKIMANPADAKNCGRQSVDEILGKTDFDLFPKELAEHYTADDQTVLKGEPVLWREEYVPGKEDEKHWMLTTKLPIRAADGTVIGIVGIGRDVTPLKNAEKKLENIHKDLVRASRIAGMAEVATSVLHNVGNVLNGINVSATLILDRLTKMKIGRVAELAKVLEDHKADLPQFLANDPRGQQVGGFLKLLAENLEQERAGLRTEVDQLGLKIDHIKQIVSMQQNYSKVAGVVEKTDLVEIVEDAIRIHSGAYARHNVIVEKQYEAKPTVFVDRHKILQILGNLLSNAKYACDGSTAKEKKVIVRVETLPGNFVRMRVTDNGMGISKENLARIFTQGFTTRREGHGFGLHGSALAAREIGGTLTVASDGPNKGAIFTLEIPADDPQSTRIHAPETTAAA